MEDQLRKTEGVRVRGSTTSRNPLSGAHVYPQIIGSQPSLTQPTRARKRPGREICLLRRAGSGVKWLRVEIRLGESRRWPRDLFLPLCILPFASPLFLRLSLPPDTSARTTRRQREARRTASVNRAACVHAPFCQLLYTCAHARRHRAALPWHLRDAANSELAFDLAATRCLRDFRQTHRAF
jgi:hypothetical protein